MSDPDVNGRHEHSKTACTTFSACFLRFPQLQICFRPLQFSGQFFDLLIITNSLLKPVFTLSNATLVRQFAS